MFFLVWFCYGLELLCFFIYIDLAWLVVSVCAGLAGSVLAWFDRPDIRSGLGAMFCFLKSCVFALVCIGLVNDALLQAGLFSLSLVLPVLFALVCSGLLHSALH